MSKTDDDVDDLPLDSPKAPTITGATTDTGDTTTRTDIDGECEEEGEEEGEGEEEEEEEYVEEEEPEVYLSEDFISGPTWSEACTMPEDILVFEYARRAT